jgi:ribosomal protein L40E
MARKSLGFVPLIWVCPSCETQNPGKIKSCTGCGAPQPDDIEFLLVEEEKFNFIKDEALIRMAKMGPDIHCPYCGTRNPSSAELCSKCGGDLSHGGKARETGKPVKTVAEAQKIASAPPPPAQTTKPKKRFPVWLFAALGIFAVIACILVIFLVFLKTDEIIGTVTSVEWERTIVIEAYTTVTVSDWVDEVPSDADILSCTQRYRYTSDSPVTNATEVCGEVTIEDTGTGAGEAVQECVYEVYDDYCEYETMTWVQVDTAVSSGRDLDPEWHWLDLTGDQREGARSESYTIFFRGDGETYQYSTTNSREFLQAEPGSEWVLNVNQLGGVQSIEPSD